MTEDGVASSALMWVYTDDARLCVCDDSLEISSGKAGMNIKKTAVPSIQLQDMSVQVLRRAHMAVDTVVHTLVRLQMLQGNEVNERQQVTCVSAFETSL